MPGDEGPLVSIIIPSLNSALTIQRCLDSVKRQTYGNIETIVVDKSSNDDTAGIAERSGAIVQVSNARERSDQVNSGARLAKGKYLYKIDSDFLLAPTVVAEAVSACEKLGYDALCVHNTSDATISFWAEVRKFERDMYKGDLLNVAARFFRRDVFFEVGGFNGELIAGEDYDLHNRLLDRGYRIGRISAEEIHIGEPRTLGDVVRKHYYYGKSIGKFLRENPWRGAMQLSPARPAFFRHVTRFVLTPRLAVGFAFYQFVRYSSALAGYLLGGVKE